MSKHCEHTVPSANATNKQIRVFAWQRTKKQYWKLAAASLLMYVPTVISLFAGLPFENSVLISAISQLVRLLFTPLTIGVTVYSYAVYLNDSERFSEVFGFFREKRLLVTSLLLGLVQLIISAISTIPNHISMSLPGDNLLLTGAVGILTIVMSLLYFYFSMRLYLTSYVFARSKSKGVLQIIEESITYTKGSVLRIIWFGITTMWWIILLFAISMGVCVVLANRIFEGGNPPLIILIYLSVSPVYLFGMPYVSMAAAGYAHKLLPSEREEKKTAKKAQEKLEN